MKKRTLSLKMMLIIGSLLLTTMLVGIASTTTTSAEPQKVEQTTFEVGGVFPIEKRPEAGRDRRDAFLIAIDELNAQTGADRILPAGVTLTPIVKDDQNTAEGGTQAANALVAEGVHIVIGSSGSSVSAAMQEVLKQYKIPQISYASSSPTLSDRTQYPYFMRVVPSDANQGKALAQLAKAFGWTKGAAIHTDDTYGTGTVQVFTSEFEALGGEMVAAQSFPPGTSDVASQLQAIKDANPEFILANMVDVDGAVVFNKADDLGLTNNPEIAWLITDGTSTTATFAGSDKVKNAMQNFIGTNPAPPSGPIYERFNETWFTITECGGGPCEGPQVSQQSGTMFNSYAPFAYDAAYAAAYGIKLAVERAGGDLNIIANGTALLEALYDVEFDGATGRIKFNDLGEVDGKYTIVQLQGDNYETLGSWDSVNGLDITVTQITLPGDSVWTYSNGKFTCTENCVAGQVSPGFGLAEFLVAVFSSLVMIEIIRRKRKSN